MTTCYFCREDIPEGDLAFVITEHGRKHPMHKKCKEVVEDTKMNNKQLGWSRTWPTKEGYYWVASRSKPEVLEEGKVRVSLAHVRGPTANNQYIYIVDGHFFYKAEVACAFWMPATLPKPPSRNEILEGCQ